MDTEKKRRQNLLLTFLYLFCLYIGIKLLPLSDWISINWLAKAVRDVLYAFVIFLSIREMRRTQPYTEKKVLGWYTSLPFLIVCCSNIIYGLIFSSIEVSDFMQTIWIDFIELALCCIIEELLFRVFILQFFLELIKKHTESFSILYSSLCFSFMHAINFVSNPPGSVFLQLGYTFFIGLVFGTFALYSNRYVLPSCLHIAFNLFNSLLPSYLFSFSYDWIYITLSIGIGLLFGVYLFLLCFIQYRRSKANVS